MVLHNIRNLIIFNDEKLQKTCTPIPYIWERIRIATLENNHDRRQSFAQEWSLMSMSRMSKKLEACFGDIGVLVKSIWLYQADFEKNKIF